MEGRLRRKLEDGATVEGLAGDERRAGRAEPIPVLDRRESILEGPRNLMRARGSRRKAGDAFTRSLKSLEDRNDAGGRILRQASLARGVEQSTPRAFSFLRVDAGPGCVAGSLAWAATPRLPAPCAASAPRTKHPRADRFAWWGWCATRRRTRSRGERRPSPGRTRRRSDRRSGRTPSTPSGVHSARGSCVGARGRRRRPSRRA